MLLQHQHPADYDPISVIVLLKGQSQEIEIDYMWCGWKEHYQVMNI